MFYVYYLLSTPEYLQGVYSRFKYHPFLLTNQNKSLVYFQALGDIYVLKNYIFHFLFRWMAQQRKELEDKENQLHVIQKQLNE